jgi:hypothetical protein
MYPQHNNKKEAKKELNAAIYSKRNITSNGCYPYGEKRILMHCGGDVNQHSLYGKQCRFLFFFFRPLLGGVGIGAFTLSHSTNPFCDGYF